MECWAKVGPGKHEKELKIGCHRGPRKKEKHTKLRERSCSMHQAVQAHILNKAAQSMGTGFSTESIKLLALKPSPFKMIPLSAERAVYSTDSFYAQNKKKRNNRKICN